MNGWIRNDLFVWMHSVCMDAQCVYVLWCVCKRPTILTLLLCLKAMPVNIFTFLPSLSLHSSLVHQHTVVTCKLNISIN